MSATRVVVSALIGVTMALGSACGAPTATPTPVTWPAQTDIEALFAVTFIDNGAPPSWQAFQAIKGRTLGAQYTALKAAYPTDQLPDFRIYVSQTELAEWDWNTWLDVLTRIVSNYGDGSDVHTDTRIALNDAAPYWVIAALEAQHPNMRQTIGDSYTRRAAARRALDPDWTPWGDLVARWGDW